MERLDLGADLALGLLDSAAASLDPSAMGGSGGLSMRRYGTCITEHDKPYSRAAMLRALSDYARLGISTKYEGGRSNDYQREPSALPAFTPERLKGVNAGGVSRARW
jgi:hypothetical protein